jgi:hypothetical protein
MHMRYATIRHLKDTDFKRLTGVQRETFEKMLAVLEKGLRDFGRPTELNRAAQIILPTVQPLEPCFLICVCQIWLGFFSQ